MLYTWLKTKGSLKFAALLKGRRAWKNMVDSLIFCVIICNCSDILQKRKSVQERIGKYDTDRFTIYFRTCSDLSGRRPAGGCSGCNC